MVWVASIPSHKGKGPDVVIKFMFHESCHAVHNLYRAIHDEQFLHSRPKLSALGARWMNPNHLLSPKRGSAVTKLI